MCGESLEPGKRGGFTLVEMLVAMAITLVMMGAVVTLFANISNSVRIRRATIELSGQLRHVRNVLQQDLQGATCPGITWQRPESNHGYIEIIEGQYREGNASNLLDADPNFPNTGTLPPNWPPSATNPEIDHVASTIPSSNLPLKDPTWVTDGGGLGDADDILMLTVRNEHEPFVGKSPTDVGDDTTSDGDPAGFAGWNYESITSPLAEVVWFAVENPGYTDVTLTDPTARHFFGEPGMRTIYRRTLLIAPWLDPYKEVDLNNDGIVQLKGGQTFKHVPGLLRMLPTNITQTMVAEAIASLISFQDRYDISARVEWDYTVGNWKIVANTLGDLTKRENRFCHYGYYFGKGASDPSRRIFPFAFLSMGGGYSGSSQPVKFVSDPEIAPPNNQAQATANLRKVGGLDGVVVSYTNDAGNVDPNIDRRYYTRPFVYVAATPQSVPLTPATAQAILNDDGRVVQVVHGPAPLWGTRRGEDVMMTDALAFDLRVYDPGAPMFATRKQPGSSTNFDLDVVLTPSDPGWLDAYLSSDNMKLDGSGAIGSNNNIGSGMNPQVVFPYVGQGAYVDLGYGFNTRAANANLPYPRYSSTATADFSTSADSWFFNPRGLMDVYGSNLAPGYCVYDTWSFHYENDGINEDNDEILNGKWQIETVPGTVDPGAVASIDEGVNGLEDVGNYYDPVSKSIIQDTRLGPDDIGERETTPPYDKPLRGMQVLVRAYERDSRAIRQVRVNQHFMPE